MALPVPHHRFTVAEYHQMAEAGILEDEDRVELINGEIIEMSPINPSHAGIVDRINKLFNRKIGASVIVRVQNPIHLDDHSEPQPDLVLVKARDDFYTKSHPTVNDILLVVEVAESSAVRDRIVKMPAYANALITELWIVDIKQDLIEVYADPAGGAYQSIRRVKRGEKVAPRALPKMTLKAKELLG
jgi:Uma2 family endonuclease